MATKTKGKSKAPLKATRKKGPPPSATDLALTALYKEQARLENEQYDIEDKLNSIHEAIDALESL